VLVANRGEIAIRIMRTLRNLNVTSVAVYSDADASAPHVAAADLALRIGPASARDSYLNIEAVLAAARECGAGAIHPGYGFLAENPAFARACEEAGLVFLGPTAKAMLALGDKARARSQAAKVGVPTIPGEDAGLDPVAIARAARSLKLPLLLKAAAGGGGKGMRKILDWTALEEAIAAAQRESLSAFGDARLVVESYIYPVRHVEVQILGDGRGDVVALGERECSLQRRHQKIIEETPSSAVSPALRAQMLEAACRVAASVNYGGLGTVEFLLGPDDRYYFLELNARLQVEHPVTEMVTGLDLVELQLVIGEGRGIPKDAREAKPRGWAIEARLYAENPEADFLPTSGRALEISWPHHPGVRIDSGIARGQDVGVHYDPLLAKVIAWGDTRETARGRLVSALRDLAVAGLVTNQSFLIDLLESEPFRTAQTFTHTVDEWVGPWKQEQATRQDHPALWMAAAVACLASSPRGADSTGARTSDGDPFSPWRRTDSWRG
jgi:acetyl/propionyl-CoA carboxylase alpha subunit